MIVYHGSIVVVENPEIRIKTNSKYNEYGFVK